MRLPPLEVIATWPKPNYTNPVTRGPTLLIVELILATIAVACVALRLWTRTHMIRRSWWDDWVMVGAAIFAVGVTITIILATQLYGWNIHVWDLQSYEISQGRKASIAGQTLYLFASGFSKSSILIGYLRIAPLKSWFRYLVWATLCLSLAIMVVFLIVLWTQCRPMSSYWDLNAPERDCDFEGPGLMAHTILMVITDCFVFTLPMPTLWHVKLPLAQRLSLMVLFGFGAVAVVAGAFRIYWVHHVIYDTYDVTWEGFELWIWTAVEINLAVICGCIPALKPLIFPAKPRKATLYYDNSHTIGSGPVRRKRSTLDLETENEDMSNLTSMGKDIECGSEVSKKQALDHVSEEMEMPEYVVRRPDLHQVKSWYEENDRDVEQPEYLEQIQATIRSGLEHASRTSPRTEHPREQYDGQTF